MKTLHTNKWISALLSTLLGLTLLLALFPGDPVQADPPPPPPIPVQERLDPPYPPNVPEEASSRPVPLSVQGTKEEFYAVADTEVWQGSPSENRGTEPLMSAGYDRHTEENRLRQRAPLRFDISSFLPSGTTIHTAALWLYMAGYCDVGSSTFRVYRVAEDWSELTATWNNQPSYAEGYGSTVISVGTAASGWYQFDVTNLVQSWVNGDYPEYGLMIRGPESAQYCAFREFVTKGGGGFNLAPVLEVDYTAPAPAMTVSPDQATFLHQCGSDIFIPSSQVIAVQSNDATLDNWMASVTGGSGWLSLSKTSGKVSSIFPDQIGISVTETLPCPGTATAQIHISAAGLGGSPQTITVTLQQSEYPAHQAYLPFVARQHSGNSALSASVNSTSLANRIALFVGIADYHYLEPPSTFSVHRSGVWGDDLLAPRSDYFEMDGRLRADYDTRITLSEELATKENFDHALEWIDEREGPDTAVLIYFSGHGGGIPDVAPLDEADSRDEMLGVYDTNDEPEFVDHVLDDDFSTQLANLETEHLGVILDACSGGGMEVSGPYRAVLAAAEEGHGSWESSKLEHGVFTYYMLQAMLDPTSDKNGDGWLSIQEIYDYALGPVNQYVTEEITETGQILALNLTRDFNVARMMSAATGQ